MHTSVVGIGASAGGLEAFKPLLARLPADTGLAFVFIQHLHPTHHSDLVKILAGVGSLPVREAGDGMEIAPNELYVIPPDRALEIVNDVLRTTPRAPVHSGPHMPINQFLQSLAAACGNRAIGVLLSGAGTDGAAGLEAVKAAGGVTFAQDPATAGFDSMPRGRYRDAVRRLHNVAGRRRRGVDKAGTWPLRDKRRGRGTAGSGKNLGTIAGPIICNSAGRSGDRLCSLPTDHCPETNRAANGTLS